MAAGRNRPACPNRSARSSNPAIRPNGLEVLKVRVPLGVVFFIYESRPNVTADAAGIVRQERQRRDPSRRQGGGSLEPGDSPNC